MNQDLGKSTLKVEGKEDCYQLVRAGLNTDFPLALWRLPFENTVYILFDLTGDHAEKPIEDLHQCFIINPYQHAHPPRPLILSGDIVIKVIGDECETFINPSLSAERIETFYRTLTSGTKTTKSTPAVELKPSNDFESMVSKAVEQIKAGMAQKIVLSRFEDHHTPEDFDVLKLFEELTSRYSGAFCHLSSSSYGVWLGASPERLISIDDRKFFQTDALAGTQLLQPTDSLMEVGWTQKEIEEQAMVSRYIIDCFKKIRLREYEEIGPRTVKAGNLAHLKTEYRVDMEATNSSLLGSTMLELLHPTSAVCGYPRDAANSFIAEIEDYDRELYAGFLGPVGFDGNTRLFVNLRCMKVFPGMVRLFAGAGITENSDPQKEYAETVYKLQTLLNVLEK